MFFSFLKYSQDEQEMFACLVTRVKFGGSRLHYNTFLEKRKIGNGSSDRKNNEENSGDRPGPGLDK